MYNRIRCCKDCKDRFSGCHSTCERYLRERDGYEELKKTVAKNSSSDLNWMSYVKSRSGKRPKR